MPPTQTSSRATRFDPTNPRRWLLVEREAGVPSALDSAAWWAVDHLFLDQDAIPTFVEVKRAADTRARREVVAQMLDYAANATEYWPVDRMRELFALRCAAREIDPVEELADVVGPEGDEAAFWELAKSNLREGRIRLLFVADRIPTSLRRIVEFLNRQMNPAEALAVEIRQFAPGGDAPLRTLVPRVIGQTEQVREAKVSALPPTRADQITRQEFIERFPDDRRATALAVLRSAEENGFAATDYRSSSATTWVRMTLAGIPGTPAYLDLDRLWVISLGRYHPALREPSANQEIRQAILRVSPHVGKPKTRRRARSASPWNGSVRTGVISLTPCSPP